MENEERIIDLLEKILEKLDSIESDVSTTAMNTGDIYSIKCDVEDISPEVKKIREKIK